MRMQFDVSFEKNMQQRFILSCKTLTTEQRSSLLVFEHNQNACARCLYFDLKQIVSHLTKGRVAGFRLECRCPIEVPNCSFYEVKGRYFQIFFSILSPKYANASKVEIAYIKLIELDQIH